ncbi:response regulator [Leptolyngbya cf. ectocarpi LEGE 11479]|uniref:Circadian input-output histidine kinase CikA n=1 Tax=Leptolyngbya cf. ectocarpi LEGE 11479 TaxID=1828722 RepID=A0A928ZYX3_LEPEC|nr:ATP-binding protein [Leptolyngbya ectocarpi]MBE9069976.1 response regulator [Leptolyngbya cf. ectocarpi LEGE 11479]
MSATILKLRSAITRSPKLITPQTLVAEAIAHMGNPHEPCQVPQADLNTYRVDFVTRELHDEIRSRYLVVVDHPKILGVLTASDLLACRYPDNDPIDHTISHCALQSFATLAESALTNLHTPLNLLRQHQLRPIVMLDEHGQIAGLLSYEEVHAVALASQVQPSGSPASSTFIAKAEPQPPPSPNPSIATQRNQVMNKIIAQVHSSLDVQTVLDTAVTELRAVLECDRIITYQLRSDLTGKVIAESVDHPSRSVLHSEVSDPCVTPEWLEPYRQGKVRIVNDIHETEMTICHQQMLVGFGIRSKMMVPIVVEGEIWGLLLASEQEVSRQWQPAEIELVRQLGVQVAIAIQQAHLVEQLHQQLTQREQAQQLLTQRNQQLAISNIELARATRLKDEFLANMSHELRTPLNAILGMTESLIEQLFGPLNEQQIKSLNTIENSGNHLLALIDDILDLAKVEAGALSLERAPTQLGPLCRSSLAFVKQLAHQKRIQLTEQRTGDSIPDLMLDERRIRQVLINLLTNAVKFTPEGGHVTLTISLTKSTAATDEYWLKFTVEDTGIGIEANQLNRLFQPFVQVDTALNRQYTGTGLGLALVKRIVELHGGEVSATSQLDVGSCFTVELPCTSGDSQSGAPETQRPGSRAPQSPPAVKPLILLAEDNEDNIDVIQGYLAAKGYPVIIAKNGQEAIALAQAQTPDLILMDIQMPGMDGIEAMIKIRQNETLQYTPIIALTALAMKGDLERCLAAGANDYLAKPVKLKQLVATMQSLLASD